MTSTGIIPKILEKIQNARRPDRFTIDFLQTKLGHSGGGARPIIPLLKRMGFVGSDGVPTPLYDQFRNTETSGIAIAKGMKIAYGELFDRNEYVYELSHEKLTGQVVEITGDTKENRVTLGIVGTFLTLKEWADFDTKETEEYAVHQESGESASPVTPNNLPTLPQPQGKDNVELKVGYTINLNLPETTDPEVFNAIFAALNQHLLKN